MPAELKSGEIRLQASVLKALAHPARLRLVRLLSKKELCVCELRDAVGGDISTVSLHLLRLKRAGLVSARRQGNWMYYSLKCRCVPQFLSCIGRVARSVSARKG